MMPTMFLPTGTRALQGGEQTGVKITLANPYYQGIHALMAGSASLVVVADQLAGNDQGYDVKGLGASASPRAILAVYGSLPPGEYPLSEPTGKVVVPEGVWLLPGPYAVG